MNKKNSSYHKLGFPDELATMFVGLAIAIVFAPYFPGQDVGPLPPVPDFSPQVDKFLKIVGPVLLFVSLLGFVKIWDDSPSEREFIKMLRVAFDRPAFRTSFANERAEEDFIHAIEDTILAMNTGLLMDRKTAKTVRHVDVTRDQLGSPVHQGCIERALTQLESISKAYKNASENSLFRQFEYAGSYHRPDWDRELANQIDDMTASAISAINTILNDVGMEPLSTQLDRDEHRGRYN